jgi:heterodisulfide reductase subunit A
MLDKKVLVIGSGVAGLCVACELAAAGIDIDVLEKADEPGGHARLFTCKAADTCVKCGACIVEEKITGAVSSPKIRIHTGARLDTVQTRDGLTAKFIDKEGMSHELTADAVIIASGFKAFDPVAKPYGYHVFDNVMTNLELEHMLRDQGAIRRPSDNKKPDRIAFIQCVGSRDGKLNHLWCSKVCCGSALRMARLIKSKQPPVEIVFFYMDVQTFGKDFHTFYSKVQNDVTMVRSIPGDIYRTEDDKLMVNYFIAGDKKGTEDKFDMVVLSVGITPGEGNSALAEMMGITLDDSGFFGPLNLKGTPDHPSVFSVGTARGPMGIAESMADAGRVALEVVKYLSKP